MYTIYTCLYICPIIYILIISFGRSCLCPVLRSRSMSHTIASPPYIRKLSIRRFYSDQLARRTGSAAPIKVVIVVVRHLTEPGPCTYRSIGSTAVIRRTPLTLSPLYRSLRVTRPNMRRTGSAVCRVHLWYFIIRHRSHTIIPLGYFFIITTRSRKVHAMVYHYIVLYSVVPAA